MNPDIESPIARSSEALAPLGTSDSSSPSPLGDHQRCARTLHLDDSEWDAARLITATLLTVAIHIAALIVFL
jgi:hypothetical protein